MIPFGFFDPTMLLVLPALVFAMWAQWKVQSTYQKYSQIRAANGLTGRQVAQAIMARNGISDVAIEEVGGMLSDHYDPRTKRVRLSPHNFEESSLAAIAVGAHEVGHVLQHAQGYAPLAIRAAVAPVAGFGSVCNSPSRVRFGSFGCCDSSTWPSVLDPTSPKSAASGSSPTPRESQTSTIARFISDEG